MPRGGGTGARAEVPGLRRGGLSRAQIWASSCVSVLGLGLCLAALGLVAYSEQGAVCVQQHLGVAMASHVDVECDFAGAGYSADKLVHFSCPISQLSLPELTPDQFNGNSGLMEGFRLRALKVRQDVSMYQCREVAHSHRERRGNQTLEVHTWTYLRVWSSLHIDSDLFAGFTNVAAKPSMESGCGEAFIGNPALPISSVTLSANSLMAGQFSQFNASRHIERIAADDPVRIAPGSYTLPRSAQPDKQIPARLDGDSLLTCSLDSPTIGCLRVTFWRSQATHVSGLSKLGKHAGSIWHMESWQAPQFWLCSAESFSSHIDLFLAGDHEAHEMIWEEEVSHPSHTWISRAVGIALVVLGICMFLQPIQIAADQFYGWIHNIPCLWQPLDFLNDVVSGTTCCAIFLLSIGVGAPTAVIVMAIVWCLVRPVPGLSCLLCVCGVIIFTTVNRMLSCAHRGRVRRGKSE